MRGVWRDGELIWRESGHTDVLALERPGDDAVLVVLNTGADGVFYSGLAKYTFATMKNGVQPYVSGDIGYWDLGTSDAFYGVPAFPAGVPYKSYTTWSLGFGWTYKVFTVDLRYTDTDLSKGDCNAFTSDYTATFSGSYSSINPSGVGSKWCGATFVAKPTSLLETERQPLNVHYNYYRHPRLGPAVYQVSINGPIGASAPGESPSRKRIFICRPAGDDDAESDQCAKSRPSFPFE